ncbi:PQQ-binding-like beta-propeller repeat protein [Streptomyces triculaminicus]|uniref:PQQ-binding-like beta-propeller repeat protein n=1 Tax=Streptomyces triculaminicus TaxID=2816232 RepID=UPI0037D96068
MSLNSNNRLPSRRALLLTAAAGVLGAGGYTGWEMLRDKDVPAPPQRTALWSFTAPEKLNYYGMSSDGRCLFVTTDQPGGLLAVDTATGRSRWDKQVGVEYWDPSGVTVADGTVYLVSSTGTAMAFRAEDGRRLWATEPLGNGAPSAPVVLGSTVCIRLHRNTDDEAAFAPGVLCGLDAGTGRVRWTAESSSVFEPLRRQQLLLARAGKLDDVRTDHRPLSALDPRTGTVRWQIPAPGGEGHVAVAPDGSALYLLDEQYRLCAHDTGTGRRQWRVPAMDGMITVAEDGSAVYVCTSRGDLAAYDPHSGDQRWRRTVAEGYCEPLVTQHVGRVFVTSALEFGTDSIFSLGGYRGYVLAVSAETGKQLWRVDRMTRCLSRPYVAGDDVIVTHAGNMWSYDARTGRPRWQLPDTSITMADPYIASGVLYALSSGGIRAIRL